MSSIIGNSINSAIVSGMNGLNKASSGMTQASMNIAQRAAQEDVRLNGAGDMLANASIQSLATIKNTLPQSAGGLTTDLLSLKMNAINAEASAKVVERAHGAVGTIIDTLS